MPKVVDHDQRRAEILHRSLPLFAAEGYGRVTMRGLAGHLGVSTGVLYHYFDGKEALFASMLRHLGELNVAAAIAGMPEGADSATRLAVLTEFMVSNARIVEQVLMVSIDYRRANPDDPLVREVLDVYRQALVADFTQGDRLKAEVALSFLLGMLTHRTLDPEGVDIGEQLTGLASILDS